MLRAKQKPTINFSRDSRCRNRPVVSGRACFSQPTPSLKQTEQNDFYCGKHIDSRPLSLEQYSITADETVFNFWWNQTADSPAQIKFSQNNILLAWVICISMREYAQLGRTCLMRQILQLTGQCVAYNHSFRFRWSSNSARLTQFAKWKGKIKQLVNE